MKLVMRTTEQRTFWRRVEWGLLSGAAGIIDGAVSVLSFGQLASSVEWETVFWLAEREFARIKDEQHYDSEVPND